MKELEIGKSVHGFTVTAVNELTEYNGTGIRLQHTATGLDLFHVSNNDPENFFAFIFKTPPRNNSGTPHIIEHAVLSGSRRFPVKDPFLQLLKGSAQTFLNAMTYPDKTVYPAASPLRKDYFNLFEVYADAVFFPLLKKEVFQQEGIRTVKGPGAKGRLSFDGIVFNEMRGVYSDHDSIVAEHSHRSLFPDTPYGFDSGGYPLDIIKLSYEEFRGFHAEYYHPSNCRIFLYGDIPTADQLKFLEENFLKEFTAIRTDSAVASPRPWSEPLSFSFTSPGTEGAGEQTGSVTVNWLAGSAVVPGEIMILEVLVEVLLGNPGAPLYHALIDSQLGRDIASMSGMEADLREMVFTVGITGIPREKAAAFEELVYDTLRAVVREGLNRDDLAAAVQRIEFQHRELRGGIPRGLRAMSRSLRGWLHGTGPQDTLLFEPVMETLKSSIEKNPRFLEEYIQERLLKNRHRSTVSVFPDERHSAEQNGALKRAAEELESSASKQELRNTAAERKKLEQYHNQEDSPEILSRIPSLSLDDMPHRVDLIQQRRSSIRGVDVYTCRSFTNGVVYVDGAFDVSGLTPQQRRLLPLFSRLLYMTGLPGSDYSETARLITRKTGGFLTFLDAATPVSGKQPSQHLFFRCKVLQERTAEALELVRDLLTSSRINDVKRIRDIILEQVSDFSSDLIPSGSSYAGLRASSLLCEAAGIEEGWRGIDQMLFLHSLKDADTRELERIGEQMLNIRDCVISRENLVLSTAVEEGFAEALDTLTADFLQGLPAESSPGASSGQEFAPAVAGQGYLETFVLPADVAFNAHALTALKVSDTGQTAYTVLAKLLSTGQLWERIRVRGGAYGAHADMNLLEGIFTLSSYRDPRIAGTFSDFSAALASIAEGGIPAEQLEQTLISLISRDLRPQPPREKSLLAFRRQLYGITDAIRQQRRDEYFSMSAETVSAAAAQLLKQLQAGAAVSVTVAGDEMVNAESKALPSLLNHVTKLQLL
jgi:presequence protease